MIFAPCSLQNLPSTRNTTAFTPKNRFLSSIHSASSSIPVWNRLTCQSDVCLVTATKRKTNEASFSRLRRGYLLCGLKNTNSEANLKVTGQKVTDLDAAEPFRGKSGSVSFVGLTHHLVEEGKLVSTPFKKSRSFLWVLAPVALISSVMLPRVFCLVSDNFTRDIVLSEIVESLSSEVIFYIGLATFLVVTDHVQRPYLQYSAKRWSLITGLRGYLTSSFFLMGFKVIAPLLAVAATWPLLGLPALVSVGPYLIGCLAQLAFEKVLKMRRSSCWPLVPIIFEVYRLYQLSKAMHFMERLMFEMRNLPKSPQLMERSGAMAAMIIVFEALAVASIWSFLTFVQRLFPSRPVADNY